jgi:hypothetical protein
MKKSKVNLLKESLDCDSVSSKSFHVGIELELKAQNEEGERVHDDDACRESYAEMLSQEGVRSVLVHTVGLSTHEAIEVQPYFDFNQWVSDRADNYCCEDDECGYWSGSDSDGDSTREDLRDGLLALTGNESFKVVSDGSINTNNGETDAEVCWNYFASTETIGDNAKIMEYLVNKGVKFDKSCGLHINLNNYLSVPAVSIPTHELSFLFNVVAASRRESSYCNRYAMAGGDNKYSMIYNQQDRLEFRFFSPTLDAEKLNNYVSLANLVYRRLAGKDVKLSKRVAIYFVKKMVDVNGLTLDRALDTINKINSILPATSYITGVTRNDESNGAA